MNFNSVTFLIFLPIVLLLYWVLPSKFRWIMLLIASYLFYMSWNAWLIFLILFTTLVSYFSGLFMEKYGERKNIKKTLLVLTLVCCLGTLFFFKYFTFAVNLTIDFFNLFNAGLPQFTFSLLLPVGISFYTFQTLSYVIDVYRGRIKAEKHLGYYALFVVYFPQLVAGPIERPDNLLPQLKAERTFNMDDFCTGLRIMVVGFFKKVVIADGVACYVNAVYNNLETANGVTAILATVLFAIQIYCDFSGYTDIAIGTARTMGIKLRDNFNEPYLAVSIKDFWRRWHISLTSWFTDYVYIPLGGNRCKIWRWAMNVMIVFLLSGLWHGAALTFVVWGAIHGIYQIIGKLKGIALNKLATKYSFKLPEDNVALTFFRRTVTFALVCFAWIFFRGNTLADCGTIITKIFTDWSQTRAALSAMGLNMMGVIRIALSCFVLALLAKIIHYEPSSDNNTATSTRRKATYLFFLAAITVAWIALAVSGEESSFIYFQF